MNINGIDVNQTASPALTGLVNEQVGQTNNQIAHNYMSGADQARGLLNQDAGTNSSLGYGDQAMSQAIKGRYQGQLTHSLSELNTKMLQSADSDHVRKLQQASDMATQEVEQNRQKEMLKYKIDQMNKAARARVVGSVLGIVGAVGGAFAGGAGGAAVGMQAGEATGNVIGGS